MFYIFSNVGMAILFKVMSYITSHRCSKYEKEFDKEEYYGIRSEFEETMRVNEASNVFAGIVAVVIMLISWKGILQESLYMSTYFGGFIAILVAVCRFLTIYYIFDVISDSMANKKTKESILEYNRDNLIEGSLTGATKDIKKVLTKSPGDDMVTLSKRDLEDILVKYLEPEKVKSILEEKVLEVKKAKEEAKEIPLVEEAKEIPLVEKKIKEKAPEKKQRFKRVSMFGKE